MTSDNWKLFLGGFLQVIFVCINSYQIATYAKTGMQAVLIGITITGFFISFVWSFNVKKVAFGGMSDRVSYASGAATGSLIGVIVASLFYNSI